MVKIPKYCGIVRQSPDLTLNLDVLISIMSYIDSKDDMLAIMSSCRALYYAGVQLLLEQTGTIRVSNEDKLCSLYTFLSTNAPRSYKALQGLDLWFTYPSQLPHRAVEYIAEVLHMAENLQELAISSKLLKIVKGLPRIITFLTNLQVLELRGPYVKEIDVVLSRLRAPIVKVDIPFLPWYLTDPIVVLGNFRDTLRHAYLSSVEFSGAAESIYPKLEALDLDRCFYPRLSALMMAFPNLKWLSIDNNELIGDEDELEAVQQCNEQFLDRIWTELDYLCVDLTILHALCLQCKVKYLWLLSTFDDSEYDLFRLRSSLVSIRPTRLRLHVNTSCLDPAYLPEILSAGTEELERLDIYLDNDNYEVEPQDTLASLFKAIQPLKLRTLDVRISWINHGPEWSSPDTERYMKKLDTGKLAARAFSTTPTLRLMIFEIMYGPIRTGYYHLSLLGLRPLSRKDGERLRNAM